MANNSLRINSLARKFGKHAVLAEGALHGGRPGRSVLKTASKASYSVEASARDPRLTTPAKDWDNVESSAPRVRTVKTGEPVRRSRPHLGRGVKPLQFGGDLLVSNRDTSTISPILTRDACKCSECVDPSDRQRNFSYADIPTNIRLSTISKPGKEGGSIVTWENDAPPHAVGKTSFFSRDTIASLKSSFRNPHWDLYRQPRQLWDADSFSSRSNRVDFNEYLNEDNTLAEALQLLWRDGLLFVDGVPESETSVSQIVNRIGPLMNTFYGPTWDVRSIPDAKNVAYTAKYLGFHMDLLYMQEPPAFQFLHCIHNESVGGESRFADTFKAVDELYAQDPSMFIDLMTYHVRYEYENDGLFYSDSKPTILKRPYNIPKRPARNAKFPLVLETVDRIHWSPPFVGELSPRRHAELVRLVSASKAFSDILERPDMVVQEKMDSGTCVIFDNLRVVHARNAFDMNTGRRWLRGAYLARQDFVSKASSLMDRFTPSFMTEETIPRGSSAS